MNLAPKQNLSAEEIEPKLKYVIQDGITAEIMAILSGGAFLVAFALKLNASNFQIGLLASLTTLASIFQLASIFLIQKFRNRRAIVIVASLIARTPLFLIGFLPFLFEANVSLSIILTFLFIYQVMGAISGLCWNSWMQDLIPQNILGTFFGKRIRIIQVVTIVVNLAAAYGLDYVRINFPMFEMQAYCAMFIIAGISGFYGVYLLSLTPEPTIQMTNQDVFTLLKIPFRDKNFKNLIIFHAVWIFAINLAAPFFTVYILKTLGYTLATAVILTIISQITNILFISIWGKYTDKYSNKSILQICGPVYLLCILAWTFTTLPDKHAFTLPLLVIIHIFSGISLSGINLALSNIGFKLAPRDNGVFYLSAKSFINALAGGIAPVIGGLLIDFFSQYELTCNIQWKGPQGIFRFYTLDFEQWDFFFGFAFIFGLVALYRLSFVKESGDVKRRIIIDELYTKLYSEMKGYSTIAGLKSFILIPYSFFHEVKEKIIGGTTYKIPTEKEPDNF